MEKSDLIKLLNEVFNNFGFKRKGKNWVVDSSELIKIVNLQKSNYGNLFYINYGFIIKDIELTTTKMHIQMRLGSYNKEETLRISNLLDLTNDIDKNVRIQDLKKDILSRVVPKLQTINTKEDLLNFIKKFPYSSMVPLVVKKYFNLGNW